MSIPSSATHSDGIPVEPKSGVNTPKRTPAYVLPRDFYIPYISDLAKSRRPSPIRGLFTVERTTPGLLSLLAGKPSAATFPIKSISFNVASQDPSKPDEETTLTIGKDSNRITEALQYSQTSGHPDFVDWLSKWQAHAHGREQDPSAWRVTVGGGGQDLMYKAIMSLTNPGDSVIIEAPVYAGVIPILLSVGADLVEVETDGDGMKSSSLRHVLENWPSGKPYPKYLYTVPYGCNPTGATQSEDRKRETLELARKYKFLILEDDPYYMLYYGTAARPASYFTLEGETASAENPSGLVLRFDSLSKVLSAGLRVGYATGPPPIIDAMDLHTSSANLQASSVAMSIAFTLLEHWGFEGLETHSKQISQFYRERRDVFETAMKKHLGDMAEWTSPVAGMFLWFKLKIPSSTSGEEGDSSLLIRTRALERGVLALPGTAFYPNGRTTAYVRASFSMLNDEQTDEALRRLGSVVREAIDEAK